MNINWFPGHMNKALKSLKKEWKKADCSCEVLDARIPRSSSNRLLENLVQDKPKMVLLNKKDLADPSITQEWMDYFQSQGLAVLATNARDEKLRDKVTRLAQELMAEEYKRRKEKGIQNKEIRLLVFGIPNSGKSTLINKLAGKKRAKVGNTPGMTRQFQWIKTPGPLLLLDSPGILWQKLDEEAGIHLAYTGAIKDEILEAESLAFNLIKDLQIHRPEALAGRYGVDPEWETMVVMDEIAQGIGALMQGGQADYSRTAQRILDDFRKLKLGRVSLERPGEK